MVRLFLPEAGFTEQLHNTHFLCTQSNTFHPRHTIVSFVLREAARTTWAALVLLDSIGNNDGGKVVPHVIHVSGVLPIAMIK